MQFHSLQDGTTVALRGLTTGDLGALHRFFAAVPDEDRQFLRYDVSRLAVVENLLRTPAAGEAYRVAAFVDEAVIGYGGLEVSDGLQRHVSKIRAQVAGKYRGQGLGSVLIRHLFAEADRRGVQKVTVKMAAPQKAARAVCEKMGFHIDAVLADYVQDAEGNLHSMVVMSCALDEVSKAMRDVFNDLSWSDG